jgi:hypothetical protein
LTGAQQPLCTAGVVVTDITCEPSSCVGVTAPADGNIGNCASDGTLAHGASCALSCESGYTPAGDQPSCTTGTLTSSLVCVADVDCAGEWSACAADCGDKTYSVTTPQSGSGAACSIAAGSTALCWAGDDQCAGACSADSDCNDHGTCTGNACVCDTGYSGAYCSRQSDCSGIAAPANGGMGDCPLSGTLAHGESCSLHCSAGYTISGDQPSCTQGTLSAAPTCAPDIDCVGSWSTCLVDCADKVFTVTTAQSGSGSHCEAADGGTMACERGAGACVGDCLTNSRCNHGTCTNQICQCDSGYSGAYCASPDGCTGISAPATVDMAVAPPMGPWLTARHVVTCATQATH